MPAAAGDVLQPLALARIVRRLGAGRCVETWGDDVPEGEVTSFPLAVRREPGESVIFSWVWWPDRATRDAAWKAFSADPDWKTLSGDPQYKDNVSAISDLILRPTAYSQL